MNETSIILGDIPSSPLPDLGIVAPPGRIVLEMSTLSNYRNVLVPQGEQVAFDQSCVGRVLAVGGDFQLSSGAWEIGPNKYMSVGDAVLYRYYDGAMILNFEGSGVNVRMFGAHRREVESWECDPPWYDSVVAKVHKKLHANGTWTLGIEPLADWVWMDMEPVASSLSLPEPYYWNRGIILGAGDMARADGHVVGERRYTVRDGEDPRFIDFIGPHSSPSWAFVPSASVFRVISEDQQC